MAIKRNLASAFVLVVMSGLFTSLAIEIRAQATGEISDAGDDSENPGPLATDLSPVLKPREIQKAMRKVADWQLRTAESRFSTDWTYAALYDGLLAASRTTGDKRYHDAVLHFAERNGWKLGTRFSHADDEAVAQSYLELYFEHRSPDRIAAIKEEADKLLARPDDPAKDLWWWCDALFMSPPALARLYKATGDKRYLDYMDRQWWLTSGTLIRPGRASLQPRRKLPRQARKERRKAVLVARQRVGAGRVRAGSAIHAGRLSIACEVRGAIPRDGAGRGGDSGRGWLVAQRTARRRSLSPPRGFRLRVLYVCSRLGNQRRAPRSQDL